MEGAHHCLEIHQYELERLKAHTPKIRQSIRINLGGGWVVEKYTRTHTYIYIYYTYNNGTEENR